MNRRKMIVIVGPSGAGKTTLGRKLGEDLNLPFFPKDDFKETLFDNLGIKDREWSAALGKTSYSLMSLTSGTMLSAGAPFIIESNFHPQGLVDFLKPLREKYTMGVCILACSAEPELLFQRSRQRIAMGDRHPGHSDSDNYDQFAAAHRKYFDARYTCGDSDIVIDVDTSDFDKVDLQSIAKIVQTFLESTTDSRPEVTAAIAPLKAVLNKPKAKVMLLGSTHFRSAFGENVYTDGKQREIEEVVDLLALFQPTKIALECSPTYQNGMDNDYNAYRQGGYKLLPEEGDQLGFRLAARFNHPKVYGVDEWGVISTDEAWKPAFDYIRIHGNFDHEPTDDELFWGMYDPEADDGREALKTCHGESEKLPLREHLRIINSQELLTVSHGAYVSWLRSKPGDYVLADHISGWWFDRNLRIYSNLRNIVETPDDRVILIIGSDHVPIIHHCVEHSSELELVEVGEYL